MVSLLASILKRKNKTTYRAGVSVGKNTAQIGLSLDEALEVKPNNKVGYILKRLRDIEGNLRGSTIDKKESEEMIGMLIKIEQVIKIATKP